jgi:hypothetical protein
MAGRTELSGRGSAGLARARPEAAIVGDRQGAAGGRAGGGAGRIIGEPDAEHDDGRRDHPAGTAAAERRNSAVGGRNGLFRRIADFVETEDKPQ